jgi:hypothetical protein
MDPASGRQPQGQVKVQAASSRALLGLSGSQTRTHTSNPPDSRALRRLACVE